MKDLDSAFEELVQACSPTTEDFDKRVQLIKRIQGALERISSVQNLRVVPYGSFVSGFYNSTSDLDLAICGSVPSNRLKPAALAEIFRGAPEESHVPVHKLDKRSRTQLLRDVGNRVISAGLAVRADVEFILHARVPLVKFTERSSGIEVDLCLGPEATAFKAWSVAQVASIHPAFGKLFRVVKVWAKAHAINDGAAHMFNSWCLTLVVIFFLQNGPQPPLLPPLADLLYEKTPPVGQPRLLQDGRELPEQVFEVMAARVTQARLLYGSRPSPALATLFRDFVADGAVKLRALLASQAALPRATRISAFYGSLLSDRPYPADYVLAVEDPYDDGDNTARTLGTWDGHPGTIHYVTSVFERTLCHLNKHMDANLETAAKGSAPAGNSAASSAAGPSSSAAPSSSSPSCLPLASTLVFLFGPELLTRLPALSARLLAPALEQWARGALAAGRPAGEVHRGMLQRLGAADEFVSFEAFKKRHNIRVHNEAKYATPEEKAARAEAEAARTAAQRERKKEKRLARLERQREREQQGQQQEQGKGSSDETTSAAAGSSGQPPEPSSAPDSTRPASSVTAQRQLPPKPRQPPSRQQQQQQQQQQRSRQSRQSQDGISQQQAPRSNRSPVSGSSGDGRSGDLATVAGASLTTPLSLSGQRPQGPRQAAKQAAHISGDDGSEKSARPGHGDGASEAKSSRSEKQRARQLREREGAHEPGPPPPPPPPRRVSEAEEVAARGGEGAGAGTGQAPTSGGEQGAAVEAVTSALRSVRVSSSKASKAAVRNPDGGGGGGGDRSRSERSSEAAAVRPGTAATAGTTAMVEATATAGAGVGAGESSSKASRQQRRRRARHSYAGEQQEVSDRQSNQAGGQRLMHASASVAGLSSAPSSGVAAAPSAAREGREAGAQGGGRAKAACGEGTVRIRGPRVQMICETAKAQLRAMLGQGQSAAAAAGDGGA